ncbi:alpha/beta hydrolase [Alistipes sp.]|uniref:alpha/beta hydrolase n=1 Tax=Alistipes sp. TaxID=1872444 RepID=UPI003AB8A5D4
MNNPLKTLLRLLPVVCLLCCTVTLHAQRVDTVEVFSPSMRKPVKNLVITPADYDRQPGKRWPVVYLLHGYNNRYVGWLRKTKPELPASATAFGMIFVCPDGAASWYWDSPVDSLSRYETYVSRELTAWVDSHYRTVADPGGRAVTGYSMGGHGALWLAFRHPDLFGACGSMSGGVDFRPFPQNWKIREQLGEYADNPQRWEEHTVLSQLYRVAPVTDRSREVATGRPAPTDYTPEPGQLAIIIDCGTEDYFYEVNRTLHERMTYFHIAHDYIVRPGSHTHAYWRKAVDFHLLFFRRFFDEQAARRQAAAETEPRTHASR